jgi:hypothetical protein
MMMGMIMNWGFVRAMRVLLLVFPLFFWSYEASASLYCVVDFSGQRCNYPDLVSCKKAAGDQGDCILNRKGMIAPVGGAPFCLVEKWKTECVYQNLASCKRQAAPRKASCISNPNLSVGKSNSGGEWGGSEWPQPQSGGGRYLPSPGYNPRPGSR